MARPKKEGLDYFPLDVDFFFGDNKIKILRARYKADGVVIYLYLLCKIYRQGYYIKADDDFEYVMSDDLGIDQNKVKQVLNFLLKRSLFNDKLFNLDKVLTSAGIQKRFQAAVKERAKKNPVEVGRYWLLSEEETEPFIKCTHFEKKQRNTNSFSGNNVTNSQEKTPKVKESKSIYNNTFQSEVLEQTFQLYLLVRRSNFGDILPEQEQALRDDLLRLSSDESEQIAIVKKATAGGWKSFYKVDKDKKSKGERKPKEKKQPFNNFQGRNYDMDELENNLLGNGGSADAGHITGDV